MLAATFLVTVVVALGAYNLLVERPRRAVSRRREGLLVVGPAPLEETIGPLPGGVFLQNGFTWSRLVPDGSIEVGVNPMLMGLVGDHAELRISDPGERIERGAELAEIGTDGRSLHLRAPVAGRIKARNRYPDGRLDWNSVRDGADAWLLRIEPDDLARDVPAWMIGSEAADWTRDRYERIREHLQRSVPAGEAGMALADGGAVPVGALKDLDSVAWESFEDAFLAC